MTETSSIPIAIQSPLNLVLPIMPGKLQELIDLLAALDRGEDKHLHKALQALGNVHFAQFVFLEKGTRLGVFTIYDGDFDAYILSFVEHIGEIFNHILNFIEGGPELRPVQEHREEFLRFIRDHDLAGLGQFSAYPRQRAFDIQRALENPVC
jgi:hypothetical protein